VGGVDLNPVSVACVAGLFGFSYSTVVMVLAVLAVCFFGWEYVEAILVLLPIPDPASF
jgi:hypothetical protein